MTQVSLEISITEPWHNASLVLLLLSKFLKYIKVLKILLITLLKNRVHEYS